MMIGDGSQPARTLTASQIADRTGRGVRAVQLWPKAGCPCTHVTEGRVTSPRFNLDEVKAWLRSRGLPGVKSAGGPDALAGSGGGSGADDDDSAVGSIFAEIWREAGGEVDFNRLIADATYIIKDLRKEAGSATGSAEAQQMASALKQASAEIRQLEVARFEKQQRQGEWVRRDTARELLTSEAGMFAADLETLGQDLPNAIVEALAGEGAVAPERADLLRRVLAVAVRSAVDRIRARRADAIERAVGMLNQADRPEASTTGRAPKGEAA